MRIAFAPGFHRSAAKLTPPQRESVKAALEAVALWSASGFRAHGLGLRRLLRQYWEVRVGLRLRIVFAIEGDLLTFTLAGTHDEVHRFLKRKPG